MQALHWMVWIGVSTTLLGCNEIGVRSDPIESPPPAAEEQALQSEREQAPPTPAPARSESPCSEKAAQAIARAYLLSIPIVEGRFALEIDGQSALTRFVQANRELFSRIGAAVVCARFLSPRVSAQGASNYDRHAGDRVIEQWGADAPEIAGEVARDVQRDVNAGAQSQMMLGQELAWLAEVLPAVADGNLAPYNAARSPSRILMREQMPAIAMLEQIDPNAARLMRAEMQKAMTQYGPAFEQQIIAMARAHSGH